MPDWILAVMTVIGAAVYLRATFALPQLFVGDSVGPQFFPALVGAGLLLAGGLLLSECWQRYKVPARAPSPQNDGLVRKTRTVLVLMTAWTALYYAMFEPLGYIAATLAYIFGLLAYFHRTDWWRNALITAVFTAAAYLVFARFLHVALPSGIL